MIYVILAVLCVIIIYLIIVIRENKMFRKEIQVLNDKLVASNNVEKVLKHNYESLKKVYVSLLKKHNTMDKEYKKLQKQIGRL